MLRDSGYSAPASRPCILVLVKHYEPAFRFGGPIRSIVNLVSSLHDEFDFKIICLNRDFGEPLPLDGIEEGVWLTRNGAQVCYLDVTLFKPYRLFKTIQSVEYDMIYFNSFFDPLFSTLPAMLMKMRLLPNRPIVLAPRGEFSRGAVALKSFKKMLFVKFQSLIGLHASDLWQATTDLEAEDIRRVLGNKVHVRIAPNLSAKVPHAAKNRVSKTVGRLRIVFLSRISPTKNLLALVHAAGSLSGNVKLDIWGPVDDVDYWRRCQQAMASLPENVVSTYCGESRHELVSKVLGEADVFALPTLGENFGHVIHEALSAGCPVVISDQTPWRNLAKIGVGFDVSLESIDNLVRALQIFADMDAKEYGDYAERCRNFAIQHSCSDADIEANRQIYTLALKRDSERR